MDTAQHLVQLYGYWAVFIWTFIEGETALIAAAALAAAGLMEPWKVIASGAGLSLPGRLLTVDRLQRRLQYRITAPLFTEHLGTVDVHDLRDGTSLVVYSTDAEPSVMALVIGGAADGALERLRDLLEGDPVKGDLPEGDRPEGDRPEGDRPEGDRPEGDRPEGDPVEGDLLEGA